MTTFNEKVRFEAVDKVSATVDRIRKNVDKAMGKSSQATKDASKSMGVLTRATKDAGSGFAQLAVRFGPAALLLGGFTMAVMKARQAIEFVKTTSSEFEATLSKVKAVTKPTGDEFAALTAKARELGRATVFTASESGQAFVEMGKLGFKVNEILTSTGDVLNIAAAAGKGLAESSETIIQTLNQYELQAEDTKNVTDLMAKAFTSTALDFDKFRESIKYVGTSAHQMDIGLEQTTALLGVLADRGIDASMAGTSLNMAFTQLADPSSRINKIFKNIGAEIETVTDKMRILGSANIDVGTAFEFLDVRAARALNILIKNIDEADNLTASFNLLDDDAKKMADTMIDNVAGASKILEAAQQDLAIEMGKAFNTNRLELIREQTKLTQDLTDDVKKNADAYASLALAGSIFSSMWKKLKHEIVSGTGDVVSSVFKAKAGIGSMVPDVVDYSKIIKNKSKVDESVAALDKGAEATKAVTDATKEAETIADERANKEKERHEAAKKRAKELGAMMKKALAEAHGGGGGRGGKGEEEDAKSTVIDMGQDKKFKAISEEFKARRQLRLEIAELEIQAQEESLERDEAASELRFKQRTQIEFQTEEYIQAAEKVHQAEIGRIREEWRLKDEDAKDKAARQDAVRRAQEQRAIQDQFSSISDVVRSAGSILAISEKTAPILQKIQAIEEAIAAAKALQAAMAMATNPLGMLAGGLGVAGAVGKLLFAAKGADFETRGPQLMVVGDNPGGRERVTVDPISGPNRQNAGPVFKTEINYSPQYSGGGNDRFVMDAIERQPAILARVVEDALRRKYFKKDSFNV